MDDRSLPAHTKATVSMSFDFGFGPVSAHRHTNGGGWVADTAIVEAAAFVGPEAQVYGKARVCGEAQVYGEARVCDKAQVYGKAQVCDKAQVYGEAQVYDEAWVYGEARVCGEARVYGKAQVYGKVLVSKPPITIGGYERLVCIVDNCLFVGCKSARAVDPLTADLWPEEICPRLRRDAHLLIKLAEAHWAECAK